MGKNMKKSISIPTYLYLYCFSIHQKHNAVNQLYFNYKINKVHSARLVDVRPVFKNQIYFSILAVTK